MNEKSPANKRGFTRYRAVACFRPRAAAPGGVLDADPPSLGKSSPQPRRYPMEGAFSRSQAQARKECTPEYAAFPLGEAVHIYTAASRSHPCRFV